MRPVLQASIDMKSTLIAFPHVAVSILALASLLVGQSASSAAGAANCSDAFRMDARSMTSAVVRGEAPLVGRKAAIDAVRSFFGWSSGMPEQLLTLRLTGKAVETKTYVDGKLDRDSSFERPPLKRIHVLLTPDLLLPNEIKLNLLVDGRELAEVSGFFSLNGEASVRHHDIVMQQIREQQSARGSNYEALVKSLHSRVTVAQTPTSLTIEFVEKSDPLANAYTITIRFEKNAAGAISRVHMTQGDAPAAYYQTTSQSYSVTEVVPFTPAEAYGR